MIKNFTIRNYKSISRLEIKKLNRVNLIVGRNNAGKSNILEALLLYASRFKISNIQLINQHRIEPISFPQFMERISLRELCLPLVKNRSLSIFKEGIELKAGEDSLKLQRVKVVRVQNGNEIVPLYRPFSKDEMGGIATTRLGMLDNAKNYVYHKLSSEPVNQIPCVYVNCAAKEMDKWTEYWDNIVLTADKKSILEALHIIAPEIEDIAVIRMQEENPKPFVKVGDHKLPLFGMGDGIVHIFNIMLALINAKDGMLLLDEMENGLHFHTLEQLWVMINTLSKAWNVQVFATTHSNDCIKAFNENAREAGNLFCVENDNNTTSYKCFDYQTVDNMLAAGIEIRDYSKLPDSDEDSDYLLWN